MKFNVISNDECVELVGEGLVLTKKENEDINELLNNMVYGCALVISTAIHSKTQDLEIRKNLADASVKLLQLVLDKHLNDVDEPMSEEGYLYNKMAEIYQEWFENECKYENEANLTKDILAYGVMPSLMYEDDTDTIGVYLEPDDEHFFSDFDEKIGSISVEMYETDRETAEATILAFECIATVLYDKVYGEDANPLRAESWVHLSEQLEKTLS